MIDARKLVMGLGLTMAAAFFAGGAMAAQKPVTCQLDEVSAFSDRVHVHCVSQGGLAGMLPHYFAVETNTRMSDKLVLLGSMALMHQRKLDMTVDDDPSHNPAGCLSTDCRRVIAVSLH